MSRALDSDTAARLATGDPRAAYQEISIALTPPGDGLLEIEILGKSHFPEEGHCVLQDGCAVGVSKLGLVQAFMVARQRLGAHIDGSALLSDDGLLAATAVILLFDPEYLTAANARKRLLHSKICGANDGRSAVEKERRFVDSLLTSRLHRHTKSPTLWSHRRWLIHASTSSGFPLNVREDIKGVVFVAGERHPRNYYAWCHARFLIGLDKSANGPEMQAAVQSWCFQHHTDISGWSFLSFLLTTGATSSGTGGECPAFSQVLTLVGSLRLANESVWVFLRTLAASGLVSDEQYLQLLAAQRALLEGSKAPRDQAVLRAALDWCQTYRKNNPPA